MDRQAEPELARPPEEPPVVGHPEGRRFGAGDVDPDDAPIAPADRLLDDDLVELEREGAVEAEDEPGLDRVFETRLVHAADGGRDDVVEVLLAAAVSLHRVEAQLHRRDVVLAVRAADDLVDRALDGERRALDELGPVEQLEVAVERAVPPRRDRDHVAELPVVLGRELDPLRVGDPPHDRRGHRAAEMAVQLRQRDLAREGARHARSIAEPSRPRTVPAGAQPSGRPPASRMTTVRADPAAARRAMSRHGDRRGPSSAPSWRRRRAATAPPSRGSEGDPRRAALGAPRSRRAIGAAGNGHPARPTHDRGSWTVAWLRQHDPEARRRAARRPPPPSSDPRRRPRPIASRHGLLDRTSACWAARRARRRPVDRRERSGLDRRQVARRGPDEPSIGRRRSHRGRGTHPNRPGIWTAIRWSRPAASTSTR